MPDGLDARRPGDRLAILKELVPRVADPAQRLQGVAFRFDQQRERYVLEVLVERKRAPTDLASHEVVFRPKGIIDASDLAPSLAGLRLPTNVSGVGALRAASAFALPQNDGSYSELQGRVRPMGSGVRIGHVDGRGGGSLGGVVRDRVTGRTFLLSNNHVLARGTGERGLASVPSVPAAVGDGILQPPRPAGLLTPADLAAELSAWIPLRYLDPGSSSAPPTNVADAALAEVDPGLIQALVPYLGADGQPVRVGSVAAALRARQLVAKVGHSTGLTLGRILFGDALLRLDYADGPAILERQVVTTHLSAPGDSGALVVTWDGQEGAGLLVGGSQTTSVFTPLRRVLNLFANPPWGLDLQLA